MKKIIALFTALCLSSALFCGCDSNAESSSSAIGRPNTSVAAGSYNTGSDALYSSTSTITAFSEPLNYTKPAEGEQIAVITVENYGKIYIKLFPELVPKAVENFTGLISNGYYDGLTFHRIVESFVVQGGDPLGTGTGGESVWGGKFPCEFSSGLLHLTGAVAYARARGDYNNGSQFYFVTGAGVDESTLKQFFAQYGKSYTQSGIDAYTSNGGQPFLDGDYTVFAQVFAGLDLLAKIEKVSTNADGFPATPVIIEKAELVTYTAELGAQIDEELADRAAQAQDDDGEQTLSNMSFSESVNATMPADGEQIVVFNVRDYGEIKIKLFPEQVPEACANFVSLVNGGYYDGIEIQSIVEDFVIQSGQLPIDDETAKKCFDCEFSDKLLHIPGSISYSRALEGEQNQNVFFLIPNAPLTAEEFEVYNTYTGNTYSDELTELYLEKGGQPILDGVYTVFGQIYEGLEILDAIEASEIDNDNVPVEKIVIESAKVVEYTAE